MSTEAPMIEEQIRGLARLAGIYIKDGAPATAAERLRTAANLCDELAKARGATLTAFEEQPA